MARPVGGTLRGVAARRAPSEVAGGAPARGWAPPSRRALAAAAAVVVLLLSLAGCGSGPAPAASKAPNHVENLTADQIVARAKQAAGQASSVHVTGSQAGTTLDLTVGHGVATGTISQDGLSAQLLSVGGNTYLKGDKQFWDSSAGAGTGDLVAGKWVLTGASASDGSFLSDFTDIGRLFDSVLSPTGTLTKTAPTTIDGQRVIGVTQSSDGSTLYVALDGPPYPLTITGAGTGGAAPTFSQWDAPLTVHPPAADQVVDPSTLGQ
jgi:hypothetical protein